MDEKRHDNSHVRYIKSSWGLLLALGILIAVIAVLLLTGVVEDDNDCSGYSIYGCEEEVEPRDGD